MDNLVLVPSKQACAGDSGNCQVSLSTKRVDFEKKAIISSMSFMEKHQECRHSCFRIVTDAQGL